MDHLAEGKIRYLQEARTGRNNTATHVVTEIQYGADAIFTFRKKNEKEGSEATVNGQLMACGEKLAMLLNGLAIGGDGDFKNILAGSNDVADVECIFTKGDFRHLPVNCLPPKTFKEAIEFAGKLMQRLSSESTEGVPYHVSLYPLVMLPGIINQDNSVPTLKQEISDHLASEFVQLAEEYDLLEEKANNLLVDNDQILSKLNPFRRKIEDFKGYLNSFRDEINTKLKELLVDIRSGRKDVVNLNQLLDGIKDPKCPFNPNRLDLWLTEKHKEICTLTMRFFEALLNASNQKDFPPERFLLFPDAMKLQEQMFKTSVSYAFHYVFPPLGCSEDIVLDRMKNQTLGYTNETTPEVSMGSNNIISRNDTTSWYEDESLLEKLERDVIIFVHSIKSHTDDKSVVFAITMGCDKDKPLTSGSANFAYKRGQLYKKNDALQMMCRPLLKVKSSFVAIVNELITKQGRNNFNIQMTVSDESPLIFLCWKYQEDNLIDFVRLFVDCGIDVNCKNNKGSNALHFLCQHYDRENLIDIVRLLLENGIDVNCTNNEGDNALTLLCSKYKEANLIDIVLLLFGKGFAKINGKRIVMEVHENGRKIGGLNALHFLCWKYPKENLLNLILLLLEYGIDANAMTTGEVVTNASSLLLERYPEVEVRDVIQLLDSRKV